MGLQVSIRPLTPADVGVFLDLVDALADYEGLPRPDPEARERLAADALSAPPKIHVLLAELDGRPAGYAAYFWAYSTFLARPTLYLEDIFVLPEARGRGVGRALMRTLARQALGNGCGRMEWLVLAWNHPAIAFYERLGATRLADWLPYRLPAEMLRQLAEEPGP